MRIFASAVILGALLLGGCSEAETEKTDGASQTDVQKEQNLAETQGKRTVKRVRRQEDAPSEERRVKRVRRTDDETTVETETTVKEGKTVRRVRRKKRNDESAEVERSSDARVVRRRRNSRSTASRKASDTPVESAEESSQSVEATSVNRATKDTLTDRERAEKAYEELEEKADSAKSMNRK
ncbi:MAG: hypothetical protein ACQEQV_04750 [Fibrobacterota bacterium]